MFNAKAVIYLALIGTICGGTVHAEDAAGQDFADHFFKACMPFVLRGQSADKYVQHAVSRTHVRTPAKTITVIGQPSAAPTTAGTGEYDKIVEVQKLQPADPNLVPDTLHGQKGRILYQMDADTPITLTLGDSGFCSVAANNMPDIEELVVTAEKQLAAFSPQFNKKSENRLQSPDVGIITNREYAAELNGRKFLVVVSTTPIPGLDQIGQAVFTVSKTEDE